MEKSKNLCFIIFIFFLFFVCAKEVQILIMPEKSELNVKAGEKGILLLNVTDPESKIAKITGVVREYPEFYFEFNDNGESGDEKASDGVWSRELEVPMDAPPGKYNMDFEVYDSAGNPIMTKSETGEEVKLTAVMTVNVE